MAGVERYGPGRDAGNVIPGDFILAHRHHPLAILISQAERRRFRGPDAPYAHWSHSALLVDGDGSLVAAELNGVKLNPLANYRDDESHLLRLGEQFRPDARHRAVAYALAQVGQP